MGMFGNLAKWGTKTLGIGGDVGKAINTAGAYTDAFNPADMTWNALTKGDVTAGFKDAGLLGLVNNAGQGVGGSASYPQSPYSLTSSSQNGSNFRTSNFGYDSQGRPNALPFESIRDASGNVGSQFQLNGGAPVNLDTSAYNSYLGQAMGQGPTNGAQAALDLNQVNTMNNLNNVNRAGATAQAGMFGNLQMTGGMSGSQRERVANNSAVDIMRERMNALNTGNTNAANIMSQDATNKMNMLSSAQNMANQNAQFAQNERAYQTDVNKYNTGNLLKDVNQFNNYNSGMWNSSMEAWGAQKTADAQAAAAKEAGKKDGLLGLGILGL